MKIEAIVSQIQRQEYLNYNNLLSLKSLLLYSSKFSILKALDPLQPRYEVCKGVERLWHGTMTNLIPPAEFSIQGHR